MRTKFSGFLTLFLVLAVQVVLAQEKTISGNVIDQDGLPLPGVNILVKGTSNGTQTDFDGNYSINTSVGQVLVFSYVGMQTSERAVGTSDVINVQMQVAAEELEGVVVTALGITREKKALGYAVSEIGGDEFERIPEVNPVQALAGKVAGLSVTGSAGTPGASSKIVIRGASTFSGETQPLIVVDGVPINNDTDQSSGRDYPFNANLQGVNNSNRAIDINPDDIESVTVLKGASAAALYGSRAGNGVILYTTKKGKKGTGLGVKITQTIEFNEVNKLPDLQSRYAQGAGGVYNPNSSTSWGPEIDGVNFQSYNNVNNFFKTGLTNSTTASVTGGKDKTTFRVSVEHTDQKGMIPNTFYKRISTRISGSNQVSDVFSYRGTVAYINSKNRAAQNGSNLSGVMLGLLRTSPNFDIREYENPDGTNRSYNGFYDNPLFTVYRNPFDSEVNRIIGNVSASLNFNKYLNFTYKAGIDAYSDRRRQIFSVSSFQNNSGDGSGEVDYNDLIKKDFYADAILSGEFEIGSKNLISYLAGHNIYYKNSADLYTRGEGFAIQNGYYNLDNASNRYASNYEQSEFSTALFFELKYDFNNQLYLTVSGRNESSSTFGENNRTFFYPSISGSWIFSETFNLKDSWLDFGKLRASYAEVGITPLPYNNKTFFTNPNITDGFTNGLSFPYGSVNGFAYSRTLGNVNLKPERKIGTEVGLALRMFNRINLDLTYYQERTEDILISRPIAKSTGFAFSYDNSGVLENKGIELQLSGDVVKSNDFNWNINLNYTQYDSETLELADGVEEVSIESAFTSIGSYAIIGEPVGVFYGTKWERNDNGQLIIGSNGVPILQGAQGGVGNPNPDWTGGIRNTFTYKNFTLSAFLDIRRGGDIYNGTYARLNRFGMTQESAEDRNGTYIIPGVKEDGTPNDIAIDANTYFSSYVGDGGAAAEQFVEKVNWLRLRDVSLSYNFNKSVYSKLGLTGLQMSVSGRNLWLDTNYKGVDPETSLTGAGSNIGGLDYFNNPGSKSYRFSVSLTF
ncbi:SusC/RagA family TonB-linked outer membrane protein [Zhouia spongiae]|uniref:SusC/RagA family TonB-linked outer membrane protein n=1 Tax=Zhouia spongiae TaxID=2202721 RepID=A0ABY3YRC1_9FLAO|nr:SusC/RagA family TonB-linked outer membrane protein [Zhouia spongiae]UNZ00401.1 SusC/RagA family TonB-linked outer membrane protein [Zhouia spongiae]